MDFLRGQRSTIPVAAIVSQSAGGRLGGRSQTFPLSQFFREVLGGAPRQRDDRVRGILVGIADERRRVGHEQVLDVVGLAEPVEHAGLRIVAHADRADFVNDCTASRDWRPSRCLRCLGRRVHPAAHAFEDRAERGLHVSHLIELVVAPRPVEPQDRNAPAILYRRGRSRRRIARSGIISPRPDRPTDVPYSSRIACFIARP